MRFPDFEFAGELDPEHSGLVHDSARVSVARGAKLTVVWDLAHEEAFPLAEELPVWCRFARDALLEAYQGETPALPIGPVRPGTVVWAELWAIGVDGNPKQVGEREPCTIVSMWAFADEGLMRIKCTIEVRSKLVKPLLGARLVMRWRPHASQADPQGSVQQHILHQNQEPQETYDLLDDEAPELLPAA